MDKKNSWLSMIRYVLAKIVKKARSSAIKNSTVHSSSKIESGTSFVDSTMDRYSFCGYDCEIYHANIGAFTSIASGVVIGGARHPMEWVSMSPVFYAGRDSVRTKFAEHVLVAPDPVNIGNDVWIGRAAILLSGISVGDGAVVGAGSVVTKDVPPYAIVAGNPAKLIRYRFANEVIEKMMEIKWWNFTDEKLIRMGRYFNQPNCFLKMMKGLGSIVESNDDM